MSVVGRLSGALSLLRIRDCRVDLARMLLLCSLLAPIGTAMSAPGQRVFSNLQVLPQDTPTAQLLEAMTDMTRDLGAECRSCHRTDSRDFASDEILAKRTARDMMRMVERMNRELSQSGAEKPVTITCMSCHQGRLKP